MSGAARRRVVLLAGLILGVGAGVAVGQDTRGAAETRAASRPESGYRWTEFVLRGRVAGPPDGLAGGRVTLLNADGVVADARVGADGVFAITTYKAPDGMRIRVSGDGMMPVFFDVPFGLPPGRTWLGERAAVWLGDPEARARRQVPFRFPPGTDGHVRDALVFYDGSSGPDVDARSELLRVPCSDGVVLLDPLPCDLVIAELDVHFYGGSDVRVLSGDLRTLGSAPWKTVNLEAVIEGGVAEASRAGYLELPFLAPLHGTPFRLRNISIFYDMRVMKAADDWTGRAAMPAGMLFTGFVRDPRGYGAVRVFGDGVTPAPTLLPNVAVRVGAVDARTGEALSAEAASDGEDLRRRLQPDCAPAVVDVRCEPNYEPARVRVMPRTAEEEPAIVPLARRSRLEGAVASDDAGIEMVWRRSPSAPATTIAVTRAGGLYGPVMIPPTGGEVFARRAGETGPAVVLAPSDEVATAPALRLAPHVVVEGVVRSGKKPAVGTPVLLLPMPEDRALLAELRRPTVLRDATAARLLTDARARAVATDRAGRYRIADVVRGDYVLIVEGEGLNPILTADVTLQGAAVRLDVDLDATTASDAWGLGASDAGVEHLVLASRSPFGPERGLFRRVETTNRRFGEGYFGATREASPRPAADGDRVLDVRLIAPGLGETATPCLIHAWPEDASVGGPVAFGTALPGGEPLRLRFRGEGRVVLRVASGALPWTTCGPYELRSADDPPVPVVVDPGRARTVVGRVRNESGGPAADARVWIEPERDRVVRGVAPPALQGGVRGDGTLVIPDLPAGRARLTVEGAAGVVRMILDAPHRDVLGDLALTAAPEEARGESPAPTDVAFDADLRRLSAEQALMRHTAGWPTALRSAVRATPDVVSAPAAATAAGTNVGPLGLGGAPLTLAFSDFAVGARVVLTALVGPDPAPGVPVLESHLDEKGDATFGATPEGRWRVTAGVPPEARVWEIDVVRDGPRRVVLSPPPPARLSIAPFDASGQRRLTGARVVVRRADALAAGLGEAGVVASGVVAGDGRAELIVPAGLALVADVTADAAGAATRLDVPAVEAGKLSDWEDVRVLPADRWSVIVRSASGPALPVAGAAVAAFVRGRWFASASADVGGEAALGWIPRGRVTLLVAADGYAPEMVEAEGQGTGTTYGRDVGLELAAPARVVFERWDPQEARLEGPGAVFLPDARAFGPRGSAAAGGVGRPDRLGVAILPTALGAPPYAVTARPGRGFQEADVKFSLPPGSVRRVSPTPR